MACMWRAMWCVAILHSRPALQCALRVCVAYLLGSAPEHNGGRGGAGALGEEVEALVANLLLLERAASADDVGREAVHGRLDGRASRLTDANHVPDLNPAGAEQALVGEVLRGEVADGKLGEHHIGAASNALVELVVDHLGGGTV